MKLIESARLARAIILAVAIQTHATPVPLNVNRTTQETNSQWQHIGFGISPAIITPGSNGQVDVSYHPNFPEDGVPIQWHPMCHQFPVDWANQEFVIKVAGVPPKERIGLCNHLWDKLKEKMGCGVTFTSVIHACGTDKVSGELFWHFEVPTICSRYHVVEAFHSAAGYGYGEMSCKDGERQNGAAEENFPSDCDTHPEDWDPNDPDKDFC